MGCMGRAGMPSDEEPEARVIVVSILANWTGPPSKSIRKKENLKTWRIDGLAQGMESLF